MRFSKWNDYDVQLTELLQANKNCTDTEIAKKLLNTNDGGNINRDVDLLRTYIKRHRARLLDQHEGIYNATNELDVPNTSVKHMWLKTKQSSIFVKNPEYIEPQTEVELEKEIDFTNIFKDLVKPIKLPKISSKLDLSIFDRLVYTDVHIGMEVNQNGYSLYDGVWNEAEVEKRLEIMVSQTLINKQSDTLIIHELGDFMDGYDAVTTRGGHSLPQNMDNQKAFDVGLSFKIRLIDALIPYYNTIECINICNDNHAGSFGYIVNSAFKAYIELKYENVKVVNQRKFIDHYIVENRCFILTHGKDDKNMKFGFKPHLDAVQIEKIKNYIDEYKLHNYKIEFSKGDSHQLLLDFTSSSAFEYQNFGAFSPPSDWVKTNFKNTNSSFIVFNYYENQKSINPIIF
jgi:hypothetical protein